MFYYLEPLMTTPLHDAALAQLFTDARTANGFINEPVTQAQLRQVYDLAKMAPTSMNTQPARFIFLTSDAAKARILPFLMDSNVEKTRNAPACVIVATDTRFYENMDKVWHDGPGARAMFEGAPEMAAATAQRNSTLSGAYFIMAARALGLDCGPMSGFDAAGVNKEFFPDGRFQVNFLINVGHIDGSKTFPRNNRLSFEEACQVL